MEVCHETVLFIQVLDLGLIVPLMVLTGVTLLRRQPLGYLLASVALIKLMTMGLALVAMIVGQALAQAPMAIAELVAFPAIALAGLALAFRLLQAMQEQPAGGVGALPFGFTAVPSKSKALRE